MSSPVCLSRSTSPPATLPTSSTPHPHSSKHLRRAASGPCLPRPVRPPSPPSAPCSHAPASPWHPHETWTLHVELKRGSDRDDHSTTQPLLHMGLYTHAEQPVAPGSGLQVGQLLGALFPQASELLHHHQHAALTALSALGSRCPAAACPVSSRLANYTWYTYS